MKKILIVLFMIMILCSCNKKSDAKNINELISYDVLDNYIKDDYDYSKDGVIAAEVSYYSNTDNGVFQAEIFSYKNKDLFSNEDYSIDENDYIYSLTNLEELSISDETFYVGYRSSEEVEDFNAVAYVRHGDYVFEFSMSNFDEQITEEQYNDFITMIETVKFNY